MGKVNLRYEKCRSNSSPYTYTSELITEKRTKSTLSAELEDGDSVETENGGVQAVRRGLLEFGDGSGIGREGMRVICMEIS